MKVDKKFTDPSKLCSSCLFDGAERDVILLTFFGHGATPCGVMTRPKYSTSLFLMTHLLNWVKLQTGLLRSFDSFQQMDIMTLFR